MRKQKSIYNFSNLDVFSNLHADVCRYVSFMLLLSRLLMYYAGGDSESLAVRETPVLRLHTLSPLCEMINYHCCYLCSLFLRFNTLVIIFASWSTVLPRKCTVPLSSLMSRIQRCTETRSIASFMFLAYLLPCYGCLLS